MVIEYISGEKVPQAELAREMETGPACGGTCLDNMSLPFLNRGYTQVSDLQSGYNTTLDELKELNSQGYLSIINIHFDTNHAYGHYIVFVGYNATGVIVHDPEPISSNQPVSRRTGPNAFISNQLLADLWSRHDQWALKVRYTYMSVPVELAYDDGTGETTFYPVAPTSMAVRFSLQAGWSGARLLTASYYVIVTPSAVNSFTVHIFDEDRATDLTPPFTATPSADGWFDVDLTGKGITVTRDFYVVITNVNGNGKPAMMADNTAPISGRSWTNGAGVWVSDPVDNYMIRAVVDPVNSIPVSSVAADVLNAPAYGVIYVLPDWQTGSGHVKPPGVGTAALSDFTALGFMFGASTNTQVMALDTNSTYFDPATGAPKVSSSVLVVFAGRGVNSVVHYYEMTGMTSPIYADITALWGVDSYAYFDRQGSVVASLPVSAGQAGTSDMFLVEYFKDANNNKVFIIYGFAWKGTYIGGVFFKTNILPNIASFTHGWYIYQWNDVNDNGLPDPYEVNTTPVNYGD
jgi:hypothetical protein